MANQTAGMYQHFFRDLADERVLNWALMKDPIYPILVVAAYLYGIYYALPQYMMKRKPYSLKRVLQVYNIAQIVLCVVIMRGVITSGWTTHLTFGCEPPDYSNDPMATRMLSYVWWTMMLKLFEFLETFFFILRKKFNQVSKLHVYHHASTFLLAWMGTKYIGGGMTTFPILLNSSVHILMYSYYFLSAFSPKVQKKIAFLKPKLTMLQMIQFCILLAHSMQALPDECPIHNFFVYMYVPDVLTIFWMFGEFYVKQYTNRGKKKA